MRRIIVTGAGGSAANNFIDALKQDKDNEYYVVGTDAKREHMELSNADKTYLVPLVSDPDYVTKMNKIIDDEKIELLHPQPDVEVAFIAANRDKFNCKIFQPSKSAVELCHHKMEFNKAVKEHGVEIPKAHHIGSKEDLEAALDDLLKITDRVWLRATRGAGSKASLPINSVYQGDAWIDYWRTFKGVDYGDFMASEFLPGAEFAWQSLWHNGELVTSQARERLEYIFGNLTPSGQTSSPSIAKTTNRDDVNEIGKKSVLAVDEKPHGIYCVDMKEDVNGVPKVTEINIGRFFTTSNFFAHAGLNMPKLYVDLALDGKISGEKPDQLNPLEDGLYWVRMIDMGYKLVEKDKWTSEVA